MIENEGTIEHKFRSVQELIQALKMPEHYPRKMLVQQNGSVQDLLKLAAVAWIEDLMLQLAAVDELLKGRQALDEIPGRLDKINKALSTTKQYSDEVIKMKVELNSLRVVMFEATAAVTEMIRLRDLKDKIDRGESGGREAGTYAEQESAAWAALRRMQSRMNETRRVVEGKVVEGSIMSAKVDGPTEYGVRKLGEPGESAAGRNIKRG